MMGITPMDPIHVPITVLRPGVKLPQRETASVGALASMARTDVPAFGSP